VDDVRRAAENATPSPTRNAAEAFRETGNRAGYAEWIALGAVVAGSVGAIIGATRCSQRAARHDNFTARPESASLTAPHGDKLGAAL
jgi:hypothetical protein